MISFRTILRRIILHWANELLSDWDSTTLYSVLSCTVLLLHQATISCNMSLASCLCLYHPRHAPATTSRTLGASEDPCIQEGTRHTWQPRGSPSQAQSAAPAAHAGVAIIRTAGTSRRASPPVRASDVRACQIHAVYILHSCSVHARGPRPLPACLLQSMPPCQDGVQPQSQSEPSQANSSRIEPSRAEPSQAASSRVESSRAESSRVESGPVESGRVEDSPIRVRSDHPPEDQPQ